ncbi:uncharacterized protein LOC100901867 [Galendromus occidentalis]|uniref:Uncharacterized protein LOC100901867 n=1 Tax=Galendromus occidentalis TaxID=34638 RepID=A0AAJ6VX69_9ACAR|nr:uncharacterized protein LOC100901867 [Galendromus occidentalis]
MWLLRATVLTLATVCVLASPKCLVSEPDKEAFVSEMFRELDSELHKIPDLRARIQGVIDGNAWREGSDGEYSSDYGESEDAPIPGVRFRVLDATGGAILPEEFIPLSTDTIAHFAMEYKKIIARKYGTGIIGFSNNAQKGCFGISRVGEAKGPAAWKIVIQNGSGKIIADDICVRKDMRVWDKYIVIIVKNV